MSHGVTAPGCNHRNSEQLAVDDRPEDVEEEKLDPCGR